MDADLIEAVRKELSEENNLHMSDHDIWRFIIARKRNIPKTISMISHFCAWYDKPLPGLDAVTPRNILVEQATDANEDIYCQYFPHSNLGHAKNGSPIYWEKTGVCSGHFQKVNKLISNDALVVRHVRQQEIVFQERCKRASDFYNRSITKQVIVFDLKHLTYTLDTHAISVFRQTLNIDEAYYPERLDHLFMINAPWYFTAIWSMLRPWIDPITAEKIVILGSDFLPTLLKYIDISQIPSDLGGERANFAWVFPESRNETDEMMALASLPTPCTAPEEVHNA